MKVRPSVKKICKNCKIVRRRRVVYVICSRSAPQAASGLMAHFETDLQAKSNYRTIARFFGA